MQYEITLPADYDMAIIRHRVATRGQGTDAFPGLGVKAYGIREKGVDGSPVNQYAPIYLWADVAGMKQFLYGPAFAGLSADFGRPVVRHWNGLALVRGPALGAAPSAAVRRTTALEPDARLEEVVDAAVEDLRGVAQSPLLHSAAVLVDPATWQLVQLTLWAGRPPEGGGTRYEVLHTSTPHLEDLPEGRSW